MINTSRLEHIVGKADLFDVSRLISYKNEVKTLAINISLSRRDIVDMHSNADIRKLVFLLCKNGRIIAKISCAKDSKKTGFKSINALRIPIAPSDDSPLVDLI